MRKELREMELVERAIDGTLSPGQAREFDRLASEQPELRARVEQERKLHHAMRRMTAGRFAPFFDQKIIQRLSQESVSLAEPATGQLAENLGFMFRRLAAPMVMACLVLAVINIYQAQLGPFGAELSIVDAMFGLPPAGPEAALLY